MKTHDFVSGLHNCREFSQPLSCLYQAMQTRKTFSIASYKPASFPVARDHFLEDIELIVTPLSRFSLVSSSRVFPAEPWEILWSKQRQPWNSHCKLATK